MRRIMLLALLALALPTAALANRISSTGSTDNIGYACSPSIAICLVGTATNPSFFTLQSPFHLTLAGTTAGAEIMITGVQLSPSPCGTTPIGGSQTCTFTSGQITIKEAGGVKEVFPIESGSFTIFPGNVRRITDFQAALGPNGSVTFLQSFEWNGSGKVFTDGSIAVVEPSHVPEPGTLEGLLLGIGLIGLPGMARRKLKLGT